MNPLLETLARLQSASGPEGFLVTLAIKGTLVLALGFAAALTLRRAPAAARHLVWCLTFAGLLLLPALALWAPQLPLALLPPAAGGLAEEGPSAGLSMAAALPPASEELSPGLRDRPPGEPSAAAGSPPALGRGALLAVAYVTGAGVFLAYLVAGGLRARRLRLGARSLDVDPGWRSLLVSLRTALGIGRDLALEASDRVAVPLAWGLRRPTVLLPAAAEAWDASQRRDVLVHELAHVARHDWVSQLGARVACALYWFHPLAWIAARRLVLEAERACDDRVLAAGADSCDYAERLLRVAGAARAARDPSYAAVAMARRSDLATRIQAILDARVRRDALRPAYAALLAGLLLLPAGFLAAATLARADAAGGDERAERLGADRDRDRDSEWDEDYDSDDWLSGDGSPADESPLFHAIKKGDRERVRRILDLGADPNAAWPGDGSPLIVAAAKGRADLIEMLIEAGADVDMGVGGDGSPLIQAADAGYLEIVRLLVEAGADVDLVVPGDENPLIRAAGSGHLEVVRLLLDRGADPNVRTFEAPAPWRPEGEVRTPLLQARRGGHDEVVRLLLARGARE